MKLPIILILLALIYTDYAVATSISTENKCDLKCDSDPELDKFLAKWYQTGKVYSYAFQSVQNVSVEARHRLDIQTPVHTQGTVHLVRGVGPELCSVTLWMSNCYATFQKLGEDNLTTINLISELQFPFRFAYTTKTLDEGSKQQGLSICFPMHDDSWANDIRRSIISQLQPFSKAMADFPIISAPPLVNLVDEFPNDDIYGGGLALYVKRGNDNSTVSKVKLIGSSHDNDNITLEVYKNLKSSALLEDDLKNIFLNNLHCSEIYNYGLVVCSQKSEAGSHYFSDHECEEIRMTTAGRFLVTNTTTHSRLTLKSVSDLDEARLPFHLSVVPKYTHKASMLPERGHTETTKDPKILQQFEQIAIGQQFCENIQNSERILKFSRRMRKLFKIIPTETLQKNYDFVKNNLNCGGGRATKLFLDVAAMSPSASTVQFIVENALKGEVGEETFRNFIYSAALIPTLEKYADFNTIHWMLHLIKHKSKLGFDFPNDEFVLNLAGFLEKIRLPKKLAEVEESNQNILTTADEYIKTLKIFLFSTENAETIDRGTKLEVLRQISKVLPKLDDMNTHNLSCDEVARNDFEKLKCYQPCDIGNSNYLRGLLQGKDTPGDLKAATYLFMRKCDTYSQKWGPLVQQILYNKDLNVEVKKFIVQHMIAAGGETNRNRSRFDLEDSSGKVKSTLGKTSFSLYESLYLYGKGSKNDYWEATIIVGSLFLPRLISISWITPDFDQLMPIELEMLRTESQDGTPEIFITLKSSGVTTYTNSLIIEPTKLLQLLANFDQNSLMTFVQSIYQLNPQFHRRIFKSRNFNLPYLMEDKTLSYLSLSGLPIIALSDGDCVFSLNYSVNQPHPKTSVFSLHPTVTCELRETIALGLGHDEVSGYEVGLSVSAGLNFRVILDRAKSGKVFMQIGFGNENSVHEEDGKGAHFEVDLLKFTRFQLTEGYTQVKKSEHIWSIESGDRNAIEEYLSFGNYSDLLSEGRCYRYARLDGLFDEESPLFLTAQAYCKIPDVNLEITSDIEDMANPTLRIKLYPSNAAVSNSYLAKVSLATETTPDDFGIGGIRVAIIKLESPKKQIGISASIVQQVAWNQSISFSISVDNSANYGFDIFFLELPSFYYTLVNVSDQVNVYQRLQNELAPTSPDNEESNFIDPTKSLLSKIQLGIKARTPFPGWEDLPILDAWAVSTRNRTPSEVPHYFITFQMKYGNGHTISGDASHLNPSDERTTEYMLDDPESMRNKSEVVADIVIRSSLVTIVRSSQFPFLDFKNTFSWRVSDLVYPIEKCYIRSKHVAQNDIVFKELPFAPLQLVYEQRDASDPIVQNSDECFSTEGAMLSISSRDFKYSGEIEHTRLQDIHTSEFTPKRLTLLELTGKSPILQGAKVHYSYEDNEIGQPETFLCGFVWEIHTMYKMEHNLTKVTETELHYKAIVSKTPSGPKFKAEGTVETSPGSWVLYRGFNITLTEDNWVDPMKVILNRIQTEEKVGYKMYVADKSFTYFDTSFSKDNDGSKRFPIKANLLAKNYIKIDLKGGPGQINFKAEIIPFDSNVNGSLKFPSELENDDVDSQDKSCFFNMSVAVYSIQKPDLLFGALDTSTALKKVEVPKCVTVVGDMADISGFIPDNYLLESRTRLASTLEGEPIELNILGQLLPEETPQPMLSIYLTLTNDLNKYGAEVLSQCSSKNNGGQSATDSIITIGNWIVLEKPNSSPLKTGIVFKLSQDVDNMITNTDHFYKSVGSLAIESNFTHPRFIFPELDTDFRLNWNIVMHRSHNGTGEDYVVIQEGRKIVSVDMNMKAEGTQSLPETKVHAEYTNYLTSRDYSNAVVGSFNSDKINHEIGCSLNKTYVGFPDKVQDPKMKQHGVLTRPVAFLGYHYKNKETLVLLGRHSVDPNFDSWTNFGLTAEHDIQFPRDGDEYSWTDDIFLKNAPNGDKTFRMSSSKLLDFTLIDKNGPREFTTTLDILHPIAFTHVSSGFKSSVTYNQDFTDKTLSYQAECVSVFWEIPMNISFDDSSRLFNHPEYQSGLKEEHSSEFVYSLLGRYIPFSGSYKNKLKQHQLTQNDISVTFVTSQLTKKENWSGQEGGLGAQEWESVAVLLQRGDWPQFLHYDYNVHRYHDQFDDLGVLHRVVLEDAMGSFSVTSPSTESPQILQILYNYEDSDNETLCFRTPYAYNELLLRIGHLNPDAARCDEDKKGWDSLSQLYKKVRNSTVSPISMRTLKDFWNKKMHCPRCQLSGGSKQEPTCDKAVGHFIVQSLNSYEAVINTKEVNNSSPSVLFNEWTEAVWTHNLCRAEYSEIRGSHFDGEDETIHRQNEKNLSDVCTTRLKDVNPCWINSGGKGCDKLFRPKQLKLWNKVVAPVTPMRMTTVANSFFKLVGLFSALGFKTV